MREKREDGGGRRFLAQLKPLDETLNNCIAINNILDDPKRLARFHEALADEELALVVYDKWVLFLKCLLFFIFDLPIINHYNLKRKNNNKTEYMPDSKINSAQANSRRENSMFSI